jgi:hypothetical protein
MLEHDLGRAEDVAGGNEATSTSPSGSVSP